MASWYRISIGAIALILSALAIVGCPRTSAGLGWTYSLENVHRGGSIAQLPDGDYFTTGYNDTTEGAVLAALRISAVGGLSWGEVIDSLYADGEWTFGAPVSASEFVVMGVSAPYDTNVQRARVLRLGANGNALWDRSYGQDYQKPAAVCTTGDGGCVIACQRTIVSNTGNNTYNYTSQVVLRKLNSVGDVLWERYLESPTGYMDVRRMAPVNGDGFVLVGGASQILRVDSNGNALWWNLFSDRWATATGVGVASDGGFVLVGTSAKSLPTPVVFKTDASGNLLWTAENIIPDQGNSQYTVRDAIVDAEGRIVLVGQLQHVSYIGNFFPAIKNQGFVMQLDPSAHMNWSKALDVYEINGVALTSTGDYVTTGSDGNHLQVIRVTTAGKVL